MEIGFIKGKISVPKVRERLIKRTKLFEKLDKALNYKLTVVNAPAGFGKSTLLSSWIHFNIKNKYYVSWVSLDEIDDDSLMFWKYIIYAINKSQIGIIENSLSMLKTFQVNENFSKSVLSILISELSNLEKDLFIVIDDLHLIESEEIYSGLKFFIKNIPQNIHLIVASRAVPNIGLSRLRTTDGLLEITQTDLSFSKEEIQCFLKDVMEIDVSRKVLKHLQERTEGWAAGLQMAALYLKGNKSEEQLINSFNGENRFILDYLVEEVFDNLDAKTQEFLLKTSIVDEMCSSLCNAILEIENSQHILENLDNLNMFMIPLDENKEWYRYHHLFKDFLRKRLEYTIKNIITQIQFNAGKWFKDNQLFSQAVTFYLKAEKYDEARNLIEKIDMEMMFSGEMKKVYEWCKLLPQDILMGNSRLCINVAWFACINGNKEETETYLKQAEVALKALKDEQIRKEYNAEVMIIRAMLATLEKDVNIIMQNLEEAYTYSGKNYFLKATIELLNGVACIYIGEVLKALEHYDESLEISKKINNYYTLVMANRSMILSKLLRGQLYESEKQCYDTIKYFEERHAAEIPVVGSIYNDLAEIYYEMNELDTAKKYAEKAYKLGMKGDVMWIIGISYTITAKILFLGGKMDEAFEYIKKAEQVTMCDKLFDDVQVDLENVKANILISTGRLKEVEIWLNYRKFDVFQSYNVTHTSYYITQVRYFIEKGLMDEAEKLVNKLCKCFEKRKVYKALGEALILKSLIYEKKGFRDTALDVLVKAINISYKENYLRIFLNEGKDLEELLVNLKEKTEGNLSNGALVFFHKVLNSYVDIMEGERSLTYEILSVREIEVLNCIKAGLTNADIAENLFVSINTVKTHLLNIYAKLDVHSRTEALVKAEKLNIFIK